MNHYYTYIFLDYSKKGPFTYDDIVLPFEPFYVGKGKNNRHTEHEQVCFQKASSMYKGFFYRKLRKILNDKTPFRVLKFGVNLSEKEAFVQEKDLIKKIGRRIKKEGPLTNCSEGGEGNSQGRGHSQKVDLFDKCGKFLRTTKSIEEAVKITGVSLAQVSRLLNGKRRYTSSNYIFRKYSKIKDVGAIAEFRNSSKARRILQFTRENVFLEEWRAAIDAQRNTGILSTAIRNCCLGFSRSAGGFVWKFK